MSYDLAVWEGERPASDADALDEFNERMDTQEAPGNEPAEPTPAIRALVAELLTKFPENDDVNDDKPAFWSVQPIIGDADGPSIYLCMPFSVADEVSAYVAKVARERGLVCFDPQMEALLP
jgi:hypothetical protein